MKKILFFFSLFAVLGVSASVNKTQYILSGSGAETAIYTVPVKFNMDGWVDIFIYNNETGFALTDATKDVNVVWAANPENNDMRLTVIYSYSYTEDGSPVSGDDGADTFWVPQIGNNISGSLDIKLNSNSINTILEKQDAVVTIKKVMLSNFGKASTDYELASAEVGGQSITNVSPNGATFYGGDFSVSNEGGQAFYINRFAIPDEYKGKYVRIDFSEEPLYDWGLNIAYENESNEGIDGGWTSLFNYVIKKDLSYYFQIPDDAATLNPQLWKNGENGTTWTVKVSGFYLTDNIEGEEYYNDTYFPLTSEGININMWGEGNTFDESTQTITFGGSYAQAGWDMSNIDFSNYRYLIVEFNEATSDYVQINIVNDGISYQPEDQYGNIAGQQRIVLDLTNGLYKTDGNNETLANRTFSKVQRFYFWNSWENANATVSIKSIYLVKEYTETRTCNAGDFGTICLPLGATVQNATVYSIKGVDSQSSPTMMYLNEVAEIEAGIPYIFKAIADGEVTFTYSYSGTEPADAPSSANGLIGLFDETEIAAENYILKNDNQLYKLENNETSGVFSAYFNVSAITDGISSGDAQIEFYNGTTVGIGNNEVELNPIVDVYTIMGIKIRSQVETASAFNGLGKGIYIIDGKKVMIK